MWLNIHCTEVVNKNNPFLLKVSARLVVELCFEPDTFIYIQAIERYFKNAPRSATYNDDATLT